MVRARDEAIEIHDFKTAQRVPRQQELDRDRQLALYQIGVAEKYGADRPIRLVWHYLLARPGAHLDAHARGAGGAARAARSALIDRIRAESVFEPRPGPLCALVRVRGDLSRERPARASPPPRGSAAAPASRWPCSSVLAGARLLAWRAMGLRIERIPTLGDNYTYLLVCEATGEAAVVDAPEAGPVLRRVEQVGARVTKILSTHHHPDHSAANPELAKRFDAPVFGHASDSRRACRA